ncbi:hypothetical protein F4821DRAFT_275120 [Hypoxylon rubiginosum]|uniref:Uncharacterized protein n=1 Tax=Hypoxylon rubiginosum TaxID=110542 RepID=A0ACC0CLF6_9PEZI|nr:hypothetical protein F4821DRAFT_275120 [Hypoxylon rubiginosum]
MTTSKETRPTPQSLPKLTIPTNRHKQEPEEITVSRVEGFLKHCHEHKQAPITQIPVQGANSGSDACKSGNDSCNSLESFETCIESPEDPQTLLFTANEWGEKDAIEAELKEAKAKHKEWYDELVAFPGDRHAMEQCRHYRLIRVRLLAEIDAIWKRREIRRMFREDFNTPDDFESSGAFPEVHHIDP